MKELGFSGQYHDFRQLVESSQEFYERKAAVELRILHSNVARLNLPLVIPEYPYEKDLKIISFYENTFVSNEGVVKVPPSYEGPTE